MITFRNDFACWWPDYDHNPTACFKYVKRGLNNMDPAIKLCKVKRSCIQAGGHAGHWARKLAREFGHVFSFEPDPALYECLRRNTEAVQNISVYPFALGAFDGKVKMSPRCSAGSWRVAADGTVPVQQITIDSLNLEHCEAIFLDIEGYEVEALKGAAKTIEKHRPIILVEELPRAKAAIRAHMAALGYIHKNFVGGDAIYAPR